MSNDSECPGDIDSMFDVEPSSADFLDAFVKRSALFKKLKPILDRKAAESPDMRRAKARRKKNRLMAQDDRLRERAVRQALKSMQQRTDIDD